MNEIAVFMSVNHLTEITDLKSEQYSPLKTFLQMKEALPLSQYSVIFQLVPGVHEKMG